MLWWLVEVVMYSLECCDSAIDGAVVARGSSNRFIWLWFKRAHCLRECQIGW